MKLKLKILLMLIFIINTATPKTINLKQCQADAIKQSPLVKQKLYVETITALDNKNTGTVYLPQFQFEATASYQSDVFTLPLKIPIPGFSMPTLPKDQYQAYVNVTQTIFDGGLSSASIDGKNAENKVNLQNIEVNLYKIKDVVNQLYFSALILTEQIKIMETVASELKNRQSQLVALMNNGVILKSNVDALEIEIKKTEQNIFAMNSDRKAVVKMLGMWINEDLSDDVNLELPTTDEETEQSTGKRPEFEYFSLKEEQLETTKDIIYAQLIPRFFAYAKAGFGSPNPMNMFATDFEGFYLVGLKMQWAPFDWFSNQRKREALDINKSILISEKENFDKSLNISLIKDKSDIAKYDELLSRDNEIIEKQNEIVAVNFTKLQNGTITSTEYLTEMNSLTQMKLNLGLHKIQKVQSKINLLTKANNY